MKQPRRTFVSSRVAASSQERNAEGSRGMFKPIKHQFFKVILEHTIRHGKLGKISLEESWKEFPNYCGLGPRNHVFFQLEGDGHFLVTIMNTSTTEIDYPVSTPPRGSNYVGELLLEPKDMDEVVEILDDSSLVTGTRAKGSNSGAERVKMEQTEEEVIEICSDASPPHRTEKKLKFKLGCPFDVVLRNLVVRKQTMVLEVGDEGWEVKFTSYESNRRGRLSTGWLPFAQDNALKLGDVCGFELISPTVFKVTIFRGVGGRPS